MRNDAIVKSFVVRGAMLLVIAGAISGIGEQGKAYAQYQGAMPSFNPNNNPLPPPPMQFWRVRNTRVFLIPGAGANAANVAVQVGRDGIAMVDTGSAEMADKVLATVKFLQNYENSIPQPLGYAIRNAQHDQFQ